MKNTFRALFPREEHGIGFQYFLDPPDFAHDATVPEASWTNAWWCAQFSLLAYTTSQDLIQQSVPQGIRARLFTQGGAECILCDDAKGHAWLAFRGTEIVSPSDTGFTALLASLAASTTDWLGNLNVLPAHWPPNIPGARVHGGFLHQLSLLEPMLRDEVPAVASRGLWLAGHSLGGAMALLAARCAWAAGRLRGIYTFGMPRAANDAFHAAVMVPHMRVVNEADAVPAVPPAPLGYTHQGTLQALTVGDLEDAFATVGVRNGNEIGLPASFMPAAFAHHAPLLYVAQCRARMP